MYWSLLSRWQQSYVVPILLIDSNKLQCFPCGRAVDKGGIVSAVSDDLLRLIRPRQSNYRSGSWSGKSTFWKKPNIPSWNNPWKEEHCLLAIFYLPPYWTHPQLPGLSWKWVYFLKNPIFSSATKNDPLSNNQSMLRCWLILPLSGQDSQISTPH